MRKIIHCDRDAFYASEESIRFLPIGRELCQPEEVDAFLLPLPVGRLPGVGKVNEEKLAKLGIKTVGELRSLELPRLEQEFGRYGVRLYELARGIDENPVVPEGRRSPYPSVLFE